MSDFISGIGSTGGIAGSSDLASRLKEMREGMQGGGMQGPGGVGGTQGGDAPRGYQVDIGKSEPGSFGDTLSRLLNEVSASQDIATDAMQRFVRGEHVELHQVMAATEEAGIALEVLVELRNKLTDTYRTLINMQS
jgi:flagellar hook-basal body complex protein FliE